MPDSSTPVLGGGSTVKHKADIGPDLIEFLLQRQRHRSRCGGGCYGGKHLNCLGGPRGGSMRGNKK